MVRWLKILHLVGMALFLGSIPGHILLGVAEPGGAIPPPGIVFAREMVKAATVFVTVPGLTLAVVTGFGMVWIRRINPLRVPWMAAHLALGVVMLLNGALLIVPAEITLAAQAHALMNDTGFDEAVWRRAALTEDAAGAANVLMALISIGIAAVRPGRRSAMATG